MIILKNRPDGCKNCPFCYTEERYRYLEVGVEKYERNYCGVQRSEIGDGECPLK